MKGIRKSLSIWVAIVFLGGCSFKKEPEYEYSYYPNDQLKEKIEISDGVYNGESKSFYESGELQGIGHWKDGQKHGVFEFFYKSGILKDTRIYDQGVLNGEARAYGKTGWLERKTNFQKGKQIGPYLIYDSLGRLSEEQIYNERGDNIYVRAFDHPRDFSIKTPTKIIVIDGTTLHDDSIQVNDEISVSISYGYDLKGKISIVFSKKDASDSKFKVDTTFAVDDARRGALYRTKFDSPGPKSIRFDVRHLEAQDTMSVDGDFFSYDFYVTNRK